jgi:hypothetical protein
MPLLQAYFIMCRVKDTDTSLREIASFDAKTVFVGGTWEEHNGDIWIELAARIPAKELAP